MKNYKEASKVGQEIILKYLKNRMKEKKITQEEISKILEIGRTTVIRYFKMETKMPLDIYLQICGILELRPYLIPKEIDNTQMHRTFFN
jgi:transcriptional regulator with XRE-family HTH domain